jgi:hypothetical protein
MMLEPLISSCAFARTHEEDGVCCLVAELDAGRARKAREVAANEAGVVLQGAQTQQQQY